MSLSEQSTESLARSAQLDPTDVASDNADGVVKMTSAFESSSFKVSQHFRFRDLPLEIRLKIYALVVGFQQRIYIHSDLDNMVATSVDPRSGHGSDRFVPDRARLLTSRRHPSNISPYEHRRRQFLSHTVSSPGDEVSTGFEASYADRFSTTVSYDMQTGKQQKCINNVSSGDQIDQCPDESTHALLVTDLRLLRACQQIYSEARSVLYQSNTFVFLDLATFSAYFGLGAPTQLHMPRCTEPNRLRTLQAMTTVELYAQIGNQHDSGLLSATRLIRTGLGCLSSLASFKLRLNLSQQDQKLSEWMIDDTVFNKPSSLRKFAVDVRIFNTCLWRSGRRVASKDKIVATEEINMGMAEEFSRRFLKQGDLSDETEDFWCHIRPLLCKPAMD